MHLPKVGPRLKKKQSDDKKNSSRPIRTKLDGNVLRGGRKEGLEGLKAGGGVKWEGGFGCKRVKGWSGLWGGREKRGGGRVKRKRRRGVRIVPEFPETFYLTWHPVRTYRINISLLVEKQVLRSPMDLTEAYKRIQLIPSSRERVNYRDANSLKNIELVFNTDLTDRRRMKEHLQAISYSTQPFYIHSHSTSLGPVTPARMVTHYPVFWTCCWPAARRRGVVVVVYSCYICKRTEVGI